MSSSATNAVAAGSNTGSGRSTSTGSRRNGASSSTVVTNSKKYNNPLYILYGSATGNSENIAKDLTKLITAANLPADDEKQSKQQQMLNAHTGGGGTTTTKKASSSPYRLDPVFDGVICCELDQYKKMGALALWESPLQPQQQQQPTIDDNDAQSQKQPLQYQYRGVIIVCSTTGNGDAPENASRFVRHIKKAATAKDKDMSNLLFQNVCYTILGLGDTNYDQYCAAAITIDRYIHLLGGHRSPIHVMKHLICADEGSGQLEDVVDPWMKTIVQQMVQACSCPTSSSSASTATTTTTTTTTTTIVAPLPQYGIKEEVKEEEEENKEMNEVKPVSTTSTIVTDVVHPPPPPLPTTNTPVVEATTTTTVSPVSSLGVQMVQSVLQLQLQLSSSTTDYSNIQIIDPAMLPTLITKPSIPGDDSFTSNNNSKPFTFVQQYDTIDEDKEVTANTDTITTAAAVQRRLRGLSIGSATSGGDQQHIPDDATASSVSAGYYYNYNNPYESQIIQARYLTHQTSIDAAQQVTDQLRQQQQLTTDDKSEMNGTTAKKTNDSTGSSVWTPSLYSKAEDIYDAAFPLLPVETTESSSVAGNVEYDKNGKRVIELTLSIPDDTSLIEYEPGDSLGLLIDNPISMVQYIVQLVQQNDVTITNPYEQLIVLHHHDGNNTTNSIKTKTPITIVDAISRYLDLCSVIKNKRILYALSLLASDPIESYYLQLMSSKLEIGITLYTHIIDEQRYNIVDLIQYVFPSLQSNITLDVLITIVPNSVPTRYYSVSSSPLQQYSTTTNGSDHHHQRFLTIAFSVVDYITPSFRLTGNTNTTPAKEIGRRRIHGIATRYLETISSPLLNCNSKVSTRTTDYQTPSNYLPVSTVRIFPKPTIDFRMPQSLLTPIILIGPGTGIAPFIGFLRHRQVLYRRYQQKSLQQNQQHQHYSHDHTPAQTIVEGTWRGGYEISSDGMTNELAISQQDESGLNVGAEYRIQQQQKQQGQQSSSLSSVSNICGPVDVFFGCRYKDHDWIYKDEMDEFVKEGIISNLYTAFSRENDGDNNNNNSTNGTTRRSYKYVQDRMIHDTECRTRFIDMIIEQNAIVYVCGDGNAMGQDVQTAIATILSKYHFHKNSSSSSNDDDDTISNDGKLYLEEMKRQQRFLMDIWS